MKKKTKNGQVILGGSFLTWENVKHNGLVKKEKTNKNGSKSRTTLGNFFTEEPMGMISPRLKSTYVSCVDVALSGPHLYALSHTFMAKTPPPCHCVTDGHLS